MKYRGRGQMIQVTKETKAHMHYVMGALRLRRVDLATRIGLNPSSLSLILRGHQKHVSMSIHNIYYPRLMELIERADRGGGVPGVRDSKSNMMNPPSSPEAKEFVLGPYREVVAARSAMMKGVHTIGRQRQIEGTKRYWAEYRRKKADGAKQPVLAETVKWHEQVIMDMKLERDLEKSQKKPAFFDRFFRFLFSWSPDAR